MNSKSFFSPIGLLAVAVFFVIAVAVTNLLPSVRIDLTEDKLYSLADGTRNIVSNLSKPIELMFFYSDSATEDLPQIRTYGNRVRELLEEIVIASAGNLTLTMIDPEPFSEDEDLATQFGIQSVPVSQGGMEIYFGLVVAEQTEEETDSLLTNRVSETMGLIRPDQEEFLEYEFLKLITKVDNPERQVVGLLTSLDIDGGFNPATGQASAPWMIMDTIRQLYEVRRIDATGDEIDSDIDILMIVHPTGFSQQMLYAIDQHILREGKAMVFLDPNADSMVTRTADGIMMPAGMKSELEPLITAWGIDFATDKVLTDEDFALQVMLGQNQQPVSHLGMLGVNRNGLAQDDIITSRLETINMSSTGSISKNPSASISFEPIIESSLNSMLMDGALMESVTDPSILFDEFVSSAQKHTIAARLTGELSSAFPEGRPVIETPEPQEGEETESDTADGEPAQSVDEEVEDAVAEPAPHIASSNGDVNIVVFADTDFLSDRLWVQVAQFLGQRIPRPFANNGDIVVNALDNLSGGSDLVSIRSRGRFQRPFDRVVNLQREADERLRQQEAELLDSLAATEASLAELNQTPDGQPIGQITPEIQAEVDRFNQEMLDTRRRLREVQFELNADIERLGSRLKWTNTLLMPALLTLLMLALSLIRMRRQRSY
ncbi:MAG: hypothetical protein DHS20C12_27650 [Pseudohongiella sp.]|nr:MAG: hypothetical protein DHS20C12_27650 [Pseudohongiella sp.]